jgi:glycosyltransferase involved in cell wall biosynthesis
MKLIGHNPDMPNVAVAESWDALKKDLATHRFYVHTADARYEDGFNMPMLEAMAAGLPVLTNRHPTTIVEHGRTGYLCDTPDQMRRYALELLSDADLAREMGERAQYMVRTSFSPMRFKVEFTRAIGEAKKKWSRRARIEV